MKKALALVLALVLALSLGVSAFALDLVELKPVATSGSSKETLEDLEPFGYDLKKTYRAPAEGGEFYFELNADGKDLKKIEVTANGAVTADVVEYDPEVADNKNASGWYITKNGEQYVIDTNSSADEQALVAKVYANEAYFTKPTGNYVWVDKDGKSIGYCNNTSDAYGAAILAKIAEGKTPAEAYKFAKDSWVDPEFWGTHAGVKAEMGLAADSYECQKALADGLNEMYRTSRFSVSNGSQNYLLKLTVAPNYTAAYKEGTFKVTATRVDAVDGKGRVTESTKVVYEGKVISDVTIFEYEEVKWAGKEDEVLYAHTEDGYSDYLTARDGYGDYKYPEAALREYPDATVISTTAFRALRENKYGIKVDSNGILVTIPEVVSGQKGVNFASYGVTFLNAKGVETTKDDVKKVVFGFYGDQTIASDFTVTADLGVNAYQLRERFGEKVEEEDIITYYVVKDGKVLENFTVDYMKDDIDEYLKLEIKGKAGTTLGEYEIVIEAPSAETEGEENPNTGAESVIGVVAAMAVVSVAAAAAVSLKK